MKDGQYYTLENFSRNDISEINKKNRLDNVKAFENFHFTFKPFWEELELYQMLIFYLDPKFENRKTYYWKKCYSVINQVKKFNK